VTWRPVTRGLLSWRGAPGVPGLGGGRRRHRRPTGTTVLNGLYGKRIEGADPEQQDELATQNLSFAAKAAAEIGATVVLEPLSGASGYPLLTAADAMAVADRVGAPNMALLADLYHLAVNGEDLTAMIDTYAGRIGHVQIADAPGRHEPGTGEIPLDRQPRRARRRGYAGWGRAGVRAQYDVRRRLRLAAAGAPGHPDGARHMSTDNSNTTVAFIGLGIMGAPMAGHLVDAGYQVVGYNRSRPAWTGWSPRVAGRRAARRRRSAMPTW